MNWMEAAGRDVVIQGLTKTTLDASIDRDRRGFAKLIPQICTATGSREVHRQLDENSDRIYLDPRALDTQMSWIRAWLTAWGGFDPLPGNLVV